MDEIRQIQLVQLELLKCFIRITEELGLSYLAIGGTALGAVRHGGFIPWDDDIDLAMPRNDYEIFLEKAPQLLPEYYFLQTYRSDPASPLYFAKLRDSRTAFIESSLAHIEMNHGIGIDIFPFDYYPKDRLAGRFVMAKKRLLSLRIRKLLKRKKEGRRHLLLEMIAWLAGTLMSIRYPTCLAVNEARDILFKSVKSSPLSINYEGAWGEKEIFETKWLEDPIEVDFEGMKVKISKDYDKWLSRLYGNYHELPPIEKRRTHHEADIIDVKRSYTCYRDGRPLN